ncbi:MAG: SAVED domain-containing protein [Fimbriimonadales bacterium]
MSQLTSAIHRHELLLTIGIFGVAQMLADTLADLEQGAVAAFIRGIGVLLIVVLLISSLSRRSQALQVPIVFTEAEKREDARAELKQFETHTRTERTVKILDTSSPVREEELYIQLREASELRKADNLALWHDALTQLVREWDEEVDERLKRWITGQYRGVVYHISPNVVLPAAFYLGASVGLRRNLKIYQRDPDSYRLAIDLSDNPRRILEPPESEVEGIVQIPDEKELPDTRGERLILHLLIGRHPPNFEAHPDHAQADSVAFYYKQSLPTNAGWLPYAQAFVQKAKPWIDRYQQVDLCLAMPHSIAMALGMAFSRSPHIRICHWHAGVYKPAAELRWIEQRLPFD